MFHVPGSVLYVMCPHVMWMWRVKYHRSEVNGHAHYFDLCYCSCCIAVYSLVAALDHVIYILNLNYSFSGPSKVTVSWGRVHVTLYDILCCRCTGMFYIHLKAHFQFLWILKKNRIGQPSAVTLVRVTPSEIFWFIHILSLYGRNGNFIPAANLERNYYKSHLWPGWGVAGH